MLALMKRFIAGAVGVLAYSAYLSPGLAAEGGADLQPAEVVDPSREPALLVRVQLDGTTVSIEPGKQQTVTIDGREVRVQASLAETRHLRLDGLSLHYPAHMAFEYDDEDADCLIWSLDGNNALLMVFRYPDAALGAREMRIATAAATLEEFGKDASMDDAPEPLRALGREIEGTRVQAQIMGTTFVQDFYGIDVGEDVYLLMLQDTGEGNAPPPSAEAEKTRALLERSLQMGPEAGQSL